MGQDEYRAGVEAGYEDAKAGRAASQLRLVMAEGIDFAEGYRAGMAEWALQCCAVGADD